MKETNQKGDSNMKTFTIELITTIDANWNFPPKLLKIEAPSAQEAVQMVSEDYPRFLSIREIVCV